jgi:hypothetical protein
MTLPRATRLRRAVAVSAALAAAALTVTAGVMLAAHPGRAVPGPAARPHRAAPPPAPRPLHPLRLVAGAGLVNGIYTRYPHSTAGAVSAAAEFIGELGSTLEPDRAATIARLTADPSYRQAGPDAASGIVSTRRRLGLPATGALPPAAAVLLVPVMYQLRDVTADRLTVLLLFDYTETVPAAISEHLGVTAAAMSWTPDGWRLMQPAAGGLSALLATPGSAAAAGKGWKALTNAV